MRPISVFKIQDPQSSPDINLNQQIENYLNQELLERLEIIKITPKKILLLGENLHLENLLKNKYPKSEIILFSNSPSLWPCKLVSPREEKNQSSQEFRKKSWLSKIFKSPADPSIFISGSFDSLPFIKNSVDLIISNLHIFNSDLKKSLPELSRILQKDGLLMLTLPGPDTFLELRKAMACIDSHTHIPIFPDMHDLGDQLLKSKFKDPVMDTERFILKIKNIKILLKNLKKIKKNKNFKLIQDPNFPRFLYTKNKFDLFKENYKASCSPALPLVEMGMGMEMKMGQKAQDLEYPVQFEITFAHAWGTDPQQIIDQEGYARVSLEGLKDSLKKESLRSEPDK